VSSVVQQYVFTNVYILKTNFEKSFLDRYVSIYKFK